MTSRPREWTAERGSRWLGRSPPERKRWLVTGQVQGVGFRPFVYRLASSYALSGFVRNDTLGVTIEAQGPADHLVRFDRTLRKQFPPLARIERVDCCSIGLREESPGFRIEPSGEGQQTSATVTIDAALCADCLRELCDPADRRFGHGLITCTHCGPRYTIVRRVPYDRSHTSMAGFAMCSRCQDEYADPANRRFHAQPIACHDCGPRVQLADPSGAVLAGDPLGRAADLLLSGRIVAVKGLGGFHLAVRADVEPPVRRLRELKLRDTKPFALLCRSLSTAEHLVRLSARAAAEMSTPACPIVLAPRRPDAPVAQAVAPGSHRLGIMLPYTPIQHLLVQMLSPDLPALVMTSGNRAAEPLVRDNAEAVRRLGGLCDAILWHDRPIERGVDDSVLLDLQDGPPLPIRRARGYVPAALPLPGPGADGAADGLCLGGELKNTVAVVRGGQAILSQHLGDLSHPLAYEQFRATIRDLCGLFGVAPAWIAHDLHPLYLSSTHARTLARERDVPLLAIQHHHAHAAAVLADNRCSEPVLAIVCDGAGYGTDQTVWGGELLWADLLDFRRLARLRLLRLPGGNAAARDTRRCGMALLYAAFGPSFAQHPAAARLFPVRQEREVIAQMIVQGVCCVPSSSAGRLFDGVAALLDLCTFNHHEAQAACCVEAAACVQRSEAALQGMTPLWRLHDDPQGELQEIDLAPLVRHLVLQHAVGADTPALAALFHEQLAWAWEEAASRAMERTGLRIVGLSGGVFCNELLTRRLTERLRGRGAIVLRHLAVPPNDGGLALGQAAIAAARATAGRSPETRHSAQLIRSGEV
jgi:hydrogenase maturation protein HypF